MTAKNHRFRGVPVTARALQVLSTMVEGPAESWLEEGQRWFYLWRLPGVGSVTIRELEQAGLVVADSKYPRFHKWADLDPDPDLGDQWVE